jgi:hypothetical protein
MNSCNKRIHRIYEFMQKKHSPHLFRTRQTLEKIGLDIGKLNYKINSYKLISESYV